MGSVSFCLRVLGFWSVYMVLAGKWKPDELISGGAVALACAALAHYVVPRNDPHYRFKAAWIIHLSKSFFKALSDSVKVLGAALGPRDLVGRVQRVPFRFGERSPEDLGRTALVTETMCLTPNTVVLECDSEREILLVHELVPSSSPVGGGNTEWPS